MLAVWNDECSQAVYPGSIDKVIVERGMETVYDVIFDGEEEMRFNVPRFEVSERFYHYQRFFICSEHVPHALQITSLISNGDSHIGATASEIVVGTPSNEVALLVRRQFFKTAFCATGSYFLTLPTSRTRPAGPGPELDERGGLLQLGQAVVRAAQSPSPLCTTPSA